MNKTKAINEYYKLEREIEVLVAKKDKLSSFIQGEMVKNGIEKIEGSEVGYSLVETVKTKYDKRVFDYLGDKIDLFRPEPKITLKKINELKDIGELNYQDLQLLEDHKEVTGISLHLRKFALKKGINNA